MRAEPRRKRAVIAMPAVALAAALLAVSPPGSSQDPGIVEDVPYVATPPAVVDEMLRMARVASTDVVYDLGSGDGRVVITAARKFGARGVGVEIDPAMVDRSRANVTRAGVADRVRILQQDIFDTDLSPATVVTLYLPPYLNLRLRERLLRLRPGTRIVSHSADLGEWQPDRRTAIRKDVLLWIVPAQVAGRWRVRVGRSGAPRLEIDFEQRYQQISGRAVLDGEPVGIWEARLEGAALRFVIVDPRSQALWYFSGKVSGHAIAGELARDVGTARTTSPFEAGRLP
jgi:SAM-dependent methyltransferase